MVLASRSPVVPPGLLSPFLYQPDFVFHGETLQSWTCETYVEGLQGTNLKNCSFCAYGLAIVPSPAKLLGCGRSESWKLPVISCCHYVGGGPNTVLESMVSNTNLSELSGPHSEGLTEFQGENFVSSSQPIIRVQQRTHRVLGRTHRGCQKELSDFSLPKQ